ncbi:MAG: TAT-variant-translocated molybdopterin oxidoreductase [Myxococcales bacterium]|nr:TAT-variant-translocated molybdopterin oxidoreductase [Myxococcales bacterium]
MSQVNDKPEYWRSVAELENDPEFLATVEREWRVPLDQEPGSPERRRFIQVMGASFALAGLSGCRWKEDKLIDFAKRPEGLVPGEARRYATTMEIGGQAVGLTATSYDGRPVKLEGNSAHPASLGAATVWHQASILELYDPDRSQSVQKGGQKSDWAAFSAAFKEQVSKLRGAGGKGLYILTGPSSSPTLAALEKQVATKYPQAKWLVYGAVANGDEERAGTKLAFGKPQRAHLDCAKAKVIVSLDADFIGPSFPMGIPNARAVAAGRNPDGPMNRLYVVESAYSHAGSMADHRLALRSELVKAFAAALDAAVSAGANAAAEFGPAQPKPSAAFLNDAKVAKYLAALAKDLVAHRGSSLIIAGPHQPAEVHALAARMNTLLGNVGTTVSYTETAESPSMLEQLKTLVADLNSGQVDTLVVLGENPVYTAPVDLDFGAAYAKAKTSVAVTSYVDETAKVSSWHVPLAHYLETWGDTRSWDGTLAIGQPLIAPLFGGKAAIEIVGMLTEDVFWSAKDLVRRTHKETHTDERKWKRLVQVGVAPARTEVTAPKLGPIAAVKLEGGEAGGLEAQNGQLELVLVACSKVYDGRWANSSWLQELPESFTKLTWGNAALFAPATAAALNITDGTPVRLSVGGQNIELPAMIAPGQAAGSVKVALGYGRLSAGIVGGQAGDIAPTTPVGANAYKLRSTKLYRFGSGLSVQGIGSAEKLATTQDVHAIDTTGREGTDSRVHMLVREGTLEEYKKEPEFAKHVVHHPPLLQLWDEPVKYDGHKWGMAIDLAKCIGCSSCITACQSENNIAVVGIDNVKRGRELLWLRVDRYYSGKADDAGVVWQPLPCQQCENAPCEQVCPVGATMHSREGLNDMVYNRCIGTRYCANNCPYKVRRFNYFNFHLDKVGPTPWHGMENDRHRVKAMIFNPEVTVRSRGVMEKCTFCVQRIQHTKINAKNAKRAIKDNEIQTACQQTCPTGAIAFGDLNDKQSAVAKDTDKPRAYQLLDELNNRPRVSYLARIKNPNPELV